MCKRLLSLVVIICFFLTTLSPYSLAHADTILNLPIPGTMIDLSPAYAPVMIKGLTVHKDNPFLFDFIVDVGQDNASGAPLKKEGEKLIKYFLASLAIPDRDLWVNLSPYEKNRIIPEALGQTDMGRDLLEQDYILKQITASLIDPEKQLGKEFWSKVYTKAQEMYGTAQIPVNTFNKVWIMADKAEVFEHNQTAFVVNQHLKVMLEEDYLALQKHADIGVTANKASNNSVGSQIVRTIILPELEKEVNTGRNFANLRQIFNSIILASWYKKNLKEALLNQVYSDKSKVKGINLNDPTVKQQIYEQYLKAYKKGVFNYIKEDVNVAGVTAPRKYFSGGMEEGAAANPTITTDSGMLASSLSGRTMMDFSAGVVMRNSDAAMAVQETGTGVATVRMHGIDPVKKVGTLRWGVLTSGGLAPHNPAIAELVAEAEKYSKNTGINIEIVGIPLGWAGAALETEQFIAKTGVLTSKAVEPLRYVGGSMLGSSRTNPTDSKKPQNQINVITNLRKLGFNALIPMGGDDTLGGAGRILAAILKEKGIDNPENPEYVKGEFEDGMTPEALVSAIKNDVNLPSDNTTNALDQLNTWLKDPDFYKDLLSHSVHAKELKNNVEFMTYLYETVADNPNKLEFVNRQVIELLYVKESPVRMQFTGLPKTMDNDLQTGGANNYGFSTFVLNTVKDLMNLENTTQGLNRFFIKEVASRNAGFTTLWTGAMVGAIRSFVPEEGEIDVLDLKKTIGDYLENTKKSPYPEDHYGIFVISEGVFPHNDLEFTEKDFEGMGRQQMLGLYDDVALKFNLKKDLPISKMDTLAALNKFFESSEIIKQFLLSPVPLSAEGEYDLKIIKDEIAANNGSLPDEVKLDKDIGRNRLKRLTRIIVETTVLNVPTHAEAQGYIWQAIQKFPGIEHYFYPAGVVKKDAFGHPKLEGAGEILHALMSVLFPKSSMNLASKALYEEREASPSVEDIFITTSVAQNAVETLLKGDALSGIAVFVGDNGKVTSTSLKSDMGGRIARFSNDSDHEHLPFIGANRALFPSQALTAGISFSLNYIEQEMKYYDVSESPLNILSLNNLAQIKSRLSFTERRIEAALSNEATSEETKSTLEKLQKRAQGLSLGLSRTVASDAAMTITVDPKLKADFPALFEEKTINGRSLDPLTVIEALSQAGGANIPAVLNARRELLGSQMPTREKYAFPKFSDEFKDAQGNVKTFGQIVQGMMDNFLGIESPDAWRLNDEVVVPRDIFPLSRPGLQVTGPSNPIKMPINQLNGDLSVRMPDLEDAAAAWFTPVGAPQEQTVGAFQSIANEAELLSGEGEGKTYTQGGKTYQLSQERDKRPVTIERVPSIHLLDNHILINGKPTSAIAISLALHFLNTHGALTLNGSGNYYYVPKIQTPAEALIVEEEMMKLEELTGLPYGTIKIEMLYEEGNAGRWLPVIMWVLRHRLIGTNVGRWDYIGSIIEMWKDEAVFPDPQGINMNSPNLIAYQRFNALLNVMAGVKNGRQINGAPIGGMAAVMLYPKTDAYGRDKNNPKALRSMKIDKLRERLLGLIFVPDEPLKINQAQPTLEDVLSGKVNGRIYDAYRQSWVATTDPEYVAAGNGPLRADISELQALLDAPEEWTEIDGNKIAPKVSSGLIKGERDLFTTLKLLNSDGKIMPWVISRDKFNKPEDLFNDKLWNDLYEIPKGDITIERVQHAYYMAAQYGFQILNGNYAAAIDDYELGLRFMNDLATYRIFVGWLWTVFHHRSQVTKDGWIKDPELVADKGVVPNKNVFEVKAGTALTPDIFDQVWKAHGEWTKAFFADQDQKGIKSTFDRRWADVIMEVLKRQLLSDRYLQHSPRVLFVIAEAKPELREQMLDAIFDLTREQVVDQVKAGTLSQQVLDTRDYVFDYYPSTPDAAMAINARRGQNGDGVIAHHDSFISVAKGLQSQGKYLNSIQLSNAVAFYSNHSSWFMSKLAPNDQGSLLDLFVSVINPKQINELGMISIDSDFRSRLITKATADAAMGSKNGKDNNGGKITSFRAAGGDVHKVNHKLTQAAKRGNGAVLVKSTSEGGFQARRRPRTDSAQTAAVNGGIDLNTSNGMQWKVSKDGHGVEMNIDPVMIERIKSEGINWLSPVIFKITPVTNIWPIIGLAAPRKEEFLAKA